MVYNLNGSEYCDVKGIKGHRNSWINDSEGDIVMKHSRILLLTLMNSPQEHKRYRTRLVNLYGVTIVSRGFCS